MTGADPLLTIAEVAVAFAGFASVVTVFRRREDGRWSGADAQRFQLMIGGSLSVVFFALLPFAFDFFGARPTTIWTASSALLAVYMSATLAFYAWRGFRILGAEGLSPRVYWPTVIGAAAATALQLLNVAGLGFAHEIGPYYLGLLYLLIVAGVSFSRLLPIGRGSVAE